MAAPKKDEVHVGQGILYVKDVRKSAKAYMAAFGMSQTSHTDTADMYAALRIGAGPENFALASQGWAKSTFGDKMQFLTPKAKLIGAEIAFRMRDVDAAYAAALKAGFTELKAPWTSEMGTRMGYLRDMDGHLISIYTMAKETSAAEEAEDGAGAAASEPASKKTTSPKGKKPSTVKKTGPKARKGAGGAAGATATRTSPRTRSDAK